MIKVQRVLTTWTVESTGGDARLLRNSCPVAFAFPDQHTSFHGVTMREWEAFQPRVCHSVEPCPELLAALEVSTSGTRVTVQPRVGSYWLPERPQRPASVTLQPGQWARWTLNYRTGEDYGWRYAMVTFNLANLDAPVERLFLGRPDVVVDERRRLR